MTLAEFKVDVGGHKFSQQFKKSPSSDFHRVRGGTGMRIKCTSKTSLKSNTDHLSRWESELQNS